MICWVFCMIRTWIETINLTGNYPSSSSLSRKSATLQPSGLSSAKCYPLLRHWPDHQLYDHFTQTARRQGVTSGRATIAARNDNDWQQRKSTLTTVDCLACGFILMVWGSGSSTPLHLRTTPILQVWVIVARTGNSRDVVRPLHRHHRWDSDT